MRILVVIPHYFHPETGARHSSLDEARRDERVAIIHKVIQAWRFGFGADQAVLNIENKAFQRIPPSTDRLTLCVLTTKGRHLLSAEFCRAHQANLIDTKPADPRYLGHEASRLFEENRHSHDLFVFSEDDLLVTDPSFLEKALWFNETFGFRRVLMPNRYEWNMAARTKKTFIDGDLSPRVIERWVSGLPDDEVLSARALSQHRNFMRARNPHSGMHVVTREQLAHWMRQPHWADRDSSFVGPLESAATLGILKTFSIYKSWGRSFGFFEVEHVDRRFSMLKLPTS